MFDPDMPIEFRDIADNLNTPITRIVGVMFIEEWRWEIKLAKSSDAMLCEIAAHTPLPPPPLREGDVAGDDMDAIAEIILYLSPNLLLDHLIIYPGYVPDSDHNVTTIIIPCGKPRMSHWHVIRYDPLTEEAIDDVVEQLGDHSRTSLSALLREAINHTFSQ